MEALNQLSAKIRQALRARALIRDSGIVGVASLIATLFQTVGQVVVVRHSSLAAFGALAAAMVYSNMVEMIVTSRSGELALQVVGKHVVQGDITRARAAAVWLERHDRLVFTAVWVVLALAAPFVAPLLGVRTGYLIALALSLPAQAGYGVSKSIFIASGQVADQARFEATFFGVAFVFGVIGVLTGGIEGYIASQVLANVAKTLLARRLTSRMVSRRLDDAGRRAYDALRAEGWGSFGVHSLLRNGMSFFAGQLDMIVLNAVAGNEATAVYKIAKSLSTIPSRASGPVWSALRPRLLSAWHAARRQRVFELVGMPALTMLVAMLICAVPVVYLSPWVIAKVYGARYAAAALPFVHLAWGTLLFQSVTGWFGFWVVIAEQRVEGTLVYAGYLALLGAGAALYGRHGAEQMALAVAVASAVASVLCWGVFVARTRALGGRTTPPVADVITA